MGTNSCASEGVLSMWTLYVESIHPRARCSILLMRLQIAIGFWEPGTGNQKFTQQECIPVGCVPAAHCLYAGVCFWGDVCSGWVGVCSWGGGCLLLGRVCSGGVVVSAPGGVCFRKGCMLRGGIPACIGCPGGCLLPGGGGGIPACIEAETPPPPHPVNRMTNRCKNITLATTSIAAGKNSFAYESVTFYHFCHYINKTTDRGRTENWSVDSTLYRHHIPKDLFWGC